MTDLLVVDEGGYPGVPEVETEFEDDGDERQDDEEEAQQRAHEVDEEVLDDEVTTTVHQEGRGDADYAIPEENKDVWKNFGYDTEAGRALRRLYSGPGQKGAAARVSYPRLISPARRWEPKTAAPKACPQRAHIGVPKPRREGRDRDDPANWYMPAPGRKPAAEILMEMEAHKPARPRLVPGRDNGAEKKGLQDKFRYAGGNMMPSGAMGHVPKGQVPDAEACRQAHVDLERWDHVDESGLTKEQRSIFCELTNAVAQKQERLKELDAQDTAEAGSKPSKAKTQRNREALQLQNDLQGCMKDIDKLLEITEE